jgi:hypothetical protein
MEPMAKPVRHGSGWRIRGKGADGRRRSETFARFEDAKLALAQRRNDEKLMRGWKRTLVVDRDGKVLIDSNAPFTPLPPDRRAVAIELPAYGVPIVESRLATGKQTGWEKVGDTVYAFDLLHPVGWYSVYEVDAESYSL